MAMGVGVIFVLFLGSRDTKGISRLVFPTQKVQPTMEEMGGSLVTQESLTWALWGFAKGLPRHRTEDDTWKRGPLCRALFT